MSEAKILSAAKGESREDRPQKFQLSVKGGMLEALGANMYTSVGKCLVEFVANGYDSEAANVIIDIPFDKIDAARDELRKKAKAEVTAGAREKFTILLEPLSEEIAIVIEDDGHGMTPTEVQEKFLALNRNRRLDGDNKQTVTKSEGNKRYVMGRKGLGKLAAFGTAEKITIWTKRKGETFATEFSMDYSLLRPEVELADHKFDAKYYENLDADLHGTKVTLTRLRCDALKAKEETICGTLNDNFWGIDPADFAIKVNGKPLPVPKVDYEYTYPEVLDADGFKSEKIAISDIADMDIKYVVKFRRRKEDFDPDDPPEGVGPDDERGSLPTEKRGVRVYCNNRLALGPSLLDMGTGMHNFHAQSYMECIVHADDLDRQEIDFVNTSRSDLRRDNEVVDTFLRVISDRMKDSLVGHSKFKGTWTEEQIKKSKYSKKVLDILKALPEKTQKPAVKILTTLASVHGIKSNEFENAAPLLLQAVNASDVMIRLIDQGHNPTTLKALAESLTELAEIENQDVLKHYRGKRESLLALAKLIKRGEAEWKKLQFEKEFHNLLKANPWIIKTEYSRYLNSNNRMATVLDSISKQLKIDEHAPAPKAVKGAKSKGKTKDKLKPKTSNDWNRPDLVFLLMDGSPVKRVLIIELKSPNIPLTNLDLTQIDNYVTEIQAALESEFPGETISVQGHLIGAMPDKKTTNGDERTLIRKIRDRETGQCEVIGLHDLLSRAQKAHETTIEVLEKEEEKKPGKAPAKTKTAKKKAVKLKK